MEIVLQNEPALGVSYCVNYQENLSSNIDHGDVDHGRMQPFNLKVGRCMFHSGYKYQRGDGDFGRLLQEATDFTSGRSSPVLEFDEYHEREHPGQTLQVYANLCRLCVLCIVQVLFLS